jgi:hypothetical protein
MEAILKAVDPTVDRVPSWYRRRPAGRDEYLCRSLVRTLLTNGFAPEWKINETVQVATTTLKSPQPSAQQCRETESAPT